jgi:hypothetical protein
MQYVRVHERTVETRIDLNSFWGPLYANMALKWFK